MISATDLVRLTPLMQHTIGNPEFIIGLIDGPVSAHHPELSHDVIRELSGKFAGGCARDNSFACRHGTFVAGILTAKRGSGAPAICPGCTLLVRPIFGEGSSGLSSLPSATPEELAQAIGDCIGAGARVLNISAAIVQPLAKSGRTLEEALNLAAERGVIVVSASGNQ